MWLLLHTYYQVACLVSRCLVCFAHEAILMIVGHSLVNLDFNNFPFLYHLVPATCLALVLRVDCFALSPALIAVALGLHDHWPHALHLDHHTLALALAAAAHLAAALPIAVRADPIALNGNFSCLSVVHFLKCCFELERRIVAFFRLWSRVPATTSPLEKIKNVAMALWLRPHALIDPLNSVPIVHLSLLFISEHLSGS